MPPKRGKKYSNITALPGGTELEALAWGYHTAKGVRGDRIAAVVNNSTEQLLSGTGQAQWAVYIPDLGVQLPASRQTVLDSVGTQQLAAAFAISGRRQGPYNPLAAYDQDQALKALSGASGSRSAFSTGSTTFPDGSILTNAKSFKAARTPAAKEKRAAREQKKSTEPLPIEDQGGVAERLFQEEVTVPVVAPQYGVSDREIVEFLSTIYDNVARAVS
jgi:hypothetical protein